MLAEPDAIDVLKNLERLPGDGAHGAGQPITKLADRAAFVLVVEARVAEKSVRRFRCHG